MHLRGCYDWFRRPQTEYEKWMEQHERKKARREVKEAKRQKKEEDKLRRYREEMERRRNEARSEAILGPLPAACLHPAVPISPSHADKSPWL